jgi:hypothetical protein
MVFFFGCRRGILNSNKTLACFSWAMTKKIQKLFYGKRKHAEILSVSVSAIRFKKGTCV